MVEPGARAESLDADAEAMLDELASGVSPPSHTLSVATGREILESVFADPDPVDVGGVTDLGIQGPNGEIPVRIYEPDGVESPPLFVFFHGGGWVRGSLESYDGLCRRLCRDGEALVVSVDYRRAPEEPFPAGLEDCYHAAAWAVEHAASLGASTKKTIVGGDSAGGNLTAAVTLLARERDGPAFDRQLLVYPAVNPPSRRTFPAYEENESGYFLELAGMENYYDQYLRFETDAGNEYAFPLLADDLTDLPPATLLTAGYDPLRDEGIAYAERLEDEGIDVTHHHYPGQIHGFVSLYEHIDEAHDAIDALVDDIASM